ncbi:MAG: hypothetical protein M1507_05240 [Candidatus Thermoplasmatota archaeon]|nr:hypothetical protein [Candidatus Thermoplasmatota archaeon]
MDKKNRSLMKSIMVISISFLISVIIVAPESTGDVSAQGLIKLTQTITGPPIIVVPPSNFTPPQGSTFVWNYSMYNNTLTGILRVHVNFNVTNRTDYWNILELVNVANLTGNINVTIVQWAKMGSTIYYDNYTKYVSVYMNHDWQTNSSPGIRLYNNTEAGPFILYPSNTVSYYIGLTYVPPVYPPSSSGSNSFGEYVQFTFDLVY